MSESIFSDKGVSYEFYKVFKNTFFIEYPLASEVERLSPSKH